MAPPLKTSYNEVINEEKGLLQRPHHLNGVLGQGRHRRPENGLPPLAREKSESRASSELEEGEMYEWN
jgi:hypothetical protein